MKLSSLLQAGLNKKTLLRAIADDVFQEVAEGLKDQLNPSTKMTLILDAGGGRQVKGSAAVFLSTLRHQHKQVVLLNIDEKACPHVLADLTQPWPFRPESFDLIVSTWVLEHLANPKTFIQEAYRALRPGGWLVLSVPFLYHKHASPGDYYRFTDDCLRYLLSTHGFEVVDIRPIGHGPFLACVSLSWPILRLFWVFPILVSLLLDWLIGRIINITNKGTWIVTAYHLGYIAVGRKPRA
jgi:SAM-dependent methyltransferase